MSDNKPNYHNHFYSAMLLIGIAICVINIVMANTKIDYFESNTNRVHRLITNVEIDLDTLEKEAVSLGKTISELQTVLESQDDKDQRTTNDLMQMNQNIQQLRSDIAEKQKQTITLNLIKAENMTQIKTSFWLTTTIMVLGLLMSISGGLALAVKLEIFQDRRNKARKVDVAVTTDK